MIILTSPDKPFPRAGKGTIQRLAATRLYDEEVNEMYARIEDDASGQTNGNENGIDARDRSKPPTIDIASKEALAASIRDIFIHRLDVLSDKLPIDGDFFSQAGVDLLQVINAARLLRDGLRAALFPTRASAIDSNVCTPRTIYNHPSPAKLAAYFCNLLDSQSNSQTTTLAQQQEEAEIRVMQSFIDKYTTGLPSACISESKQLPRHASQTVVVTGTTGSLGAYLLDALISDTAAVSKVVALNRDADGGRKRQVTVSGSRGLPTDQFDSRVTFIHADLLQPHLGLDPTTYKQLLADVDRFVHNAWPVHFNYGIGTFEPSIAGVRRLVNFSAEAARRVPIVFISSVGTAHGWARSATSTTPIIPEAKHEDLRVASMGYGRSKMVSSRILDAAAEESGIPTVSIRVGQIAGPRGRKDSQPSWNAHKTTPGKWNPQEMLPSVVASSVYMGVLPRSVGVMNHVDWLPVEDVAGTILDMAGINGNSDLDGAVTQQHYYHCINPRVTKWESLLPAIREVYDGRIKATVSLREWYTKLQESASVAENVQNRKSGTNSSAKQHGNTTSDDIAIKNPCIKLIDTVWSFLESEESKEKPLVFALEKSIKRSPTLRNLGAITPELMKTWCIQWDY